MPRKPPVDYRDSSADRVRSFTLLTNVLVKILADRFAYLSTINSSDLIDRTYENLTDEILSTCMDRIRALTHRPIRKNDPNYYDDSPYDTSSRYGRRSQEAAAFSRATRTNQPQKEKRR